MLEATQIFKAYPTGDGQIDVLRGIDFEVKKGEIVAVVGSSGVGKSSLLHILGGLDDPSSGKVLVDGTDVLPCRMPNALIFATSTLGSCFSFTIY